MEIKPLKQYSPKEVDQSLFETGKKIYPRALTGWFAAWRWTMVWLTQIIFYGTTWLTWNDRQAVLFDLVARKFYIFGMVFWPQDFIYLAVLLVIAALSLFLFTAVAGRVFCGYACPQTVYTEIFMWIERKIEGDRAKRMRIDDAAMSPRKFIIKTAKHAAWIAVALWTGFTFVGYFTPIRTLAAEVVSFDLGPWQIFWILFYGFATYGNAGWMREQVCKYMCPYARFQSAMFDKDTLTVTYDGLRGEPRGSRSKQADLSTLNLGSCINCTLCVQVCPTGIDIRNGLQYECIGCAACIDVCDQVMDKMHYPRGLIRYTTEHALVENLSKRGIWGRVLRPRTLIYAGILGSIILITALSLAMRLPLKVDVLRDRGMPRIMEDGSVHNVYRLQVMNTEEAPHRYTVEVGGIPGAEIISDNSFAVPAASSTAVPVRVRVASGQAEPGSNKIIFTVQDHDDKRVSVTEKAVFLIPR
ncbi:MAG: cytochrome c oxidase accessory protein CcoG [Glaciimonas sp.]|nr:cytochrome c oxidase accessory protein CcoG [Glaciimonas sp.]